MTGVLLGIHATLAEWRQIPELYLSEEEAHAFFVACQKVARHYDIPTTQRTIDWISLIGCVGTIYGRRYSAYSLRIYTEQMDRRNNVVHIRPQNHQTAQQPANNPNAPPGSAEKQNGAAPPSQPSPVMDYGSLDIRPEPDVDA